MGEAIGAVLGPATGVALSPVPLAVMVMTLVGVGGHARRLALLVGWLLGLALALAVFTSVGPVVAPDRSADTLEHLRTWLVAHNTTVVFVVLVLMGTNLIGDGIRGLA